MQAFTFLWLDDRHQYGPGYEAAAATLHSMAGRLTALEVPRTTPAILAAMQQAGPALSQSLSFLSFGTDSSEPQEDLRMAAQAVQALAAGLQHVELTFMTWRKISSAAEVQAADAALEQLMRSLPCCQRLHLGLGRCISPEAVRGALLHHAPYLRSVNLCSRNGRSSSRGLDEQVSLASACNMIAAMILSLHNLISHGSM
jgi:hypothetical protein